VEPGKYLDNIKNIDCMAGTLRLAKAALMSNVKKFVGLGTCFEYEISKKFLSINSPTKPHTLYGHIKLNTYKSLESMFVTSEVDFLWCRLFYIYGEGDDERRLSGYIESCIKKNQTAYLSHGMQIRDYLDVQKAADKIVEYSFDSSIGVRNICSSIPISIKELAFKIAQKQNSLSLLMFDKFSQNKLDHPCVVGITETSIKGINISKLQNKLIILKKYRKWY
jgi:dTDP-6-deoxy-L-talose 4-dehydrogenase (NAD+)